MGMMPVGTVAAWLSALQALLPRGFIWPRGRDATLTRVLDGAAAGLSRLDGESPRLLAELDPRTTAEMLPDWERALGLPDACTGLAPTADQRRSDVVWKYTLRGDLSPAFYIERAARAGFAITVEENHAARCGAFRMGDTLQGERWAYEWKVRAPETTVTPMRIGDTCGTRLRSWGNHRLECLLTPLAPAGTALHFAYGS
jgi:uncharacterized protein YmfQ (DUF2313 family)